MSSAPNRQPPSTLGSIFEVYRIGPGPSSSHSMGPQRAARRFIEMLTTPPAKVRVTLCGSLAATGKGHLTDVALAGGLGPIPHDVVWDTTSTDLPHPNTMRFEAFDAASQCVRDWTVISTGGGNLADATGPVGDLPPATYTVCGIDDVIAACEPTAVPYWRFVERHETDLWPRLEQVWHAMRKAVEHGLHSHQVTLPGELHVRRRAKSVYQRLLPLDSPRRDLALLSAFALAVAEENANAGIVVSAPTCGSCGVVPGLLYYYESVKGVAPQQILQALATAGLFGAAIKANASISGAEVGCQGEIGTACSMAAAAAAHIIGGSLYQIEYAAEIAMEHHLGLTCDPVLGYVQIPCIERNMTACLRAFESASFALLTDGRHLVSFDDVVSVMYQTGRDLQSTYRETAGGGLSLLWSHRGATARREP